MITGSQLRAARALLGISAITLSEKSGVGWATIQRFENVDGIPVSRSGTLQRVKTALEAQGIEFLGDPLTSPGVQLRRNDRDEAETK